MTHVRFSLRWLLALVALIGLVCGSLTSSSYLWAAGVFTFTLGMLSVGILGAVFGWAERRAFWVGFELFGWGYLLLAFGPWFQGNVGDKLITTHLFADLHPKLQRKLAPPASDGASDVTSTVNDGWQGASMPMGSNSLILEASLNYAAGSTSNPSMLGGGTRSGAWRVGGTVLVGPAFEHVQRVGHSLAAMLAGLLGGLIGRVFYLQRGASAQPHTSQPPTGISREPSQTPDYCSRDSAISSSSASNQSC